MEYLTNTEEITSIADAIRLKGGTNGSLTYPDGFVSAIEAIVTQPGLQAKTVTPTVSQQVVAPDTGTYGLSQVTVDPIPDNYGLITYSGGVITVS